MRFPCFMGVDIGSTKQLVAANRSVEEVRRFIGADSLAYISIPGLMRAVGRGTIDAMNQLGIDAAAIGNHEFDWSIDTLRARMAEAKYPFLSANITSADGAARPEWATRRERG